MEKFEGGWQVEQNAVSSGVRLREAATFQQSKFADTIEIMLKSIYIVLRIKIGHNALILTLSDVSHSLITPNATPEKQTIRSVKKKSWKWEWRVKYYVCRKQRHNTIQEDLGLGCREDVRCDI